MRYYNSTKVIIYVDPQTRRIRIIVDCYIDEYDVKLHLEEYISIVALMLQEYPYQVYQPRNL